MARLRSGTVKVRSSADGSTVMDASPPKASSSASRARIERRPVDLLASHLEAAARAGLDRVGAVNPVGHEVAFADGLLERVAEGGLAHLEEAQRVADEGRLVGVRVVGG